MRYISMIATNSNDFIKYYFSQVKEKQFYFLKSQV